jgi:hypothetical protein
LGKSNHSSSKTSPKKPPPKKNLFLGNTYSFKPNLGPANQSDTISKKDKESQWDTIPRICHGSVAKAKYVLEPNTCKFDRIWLDDFKEGR